MAEITPLTKCLGSTTHSSHFSNVPIEPKSLRPDLRLPKSLPSFPTRDFPSEPRGRGRVDQEGSAVLKWVDVGGGGAARSVDVDVDDAVDDDDLRGAADEALKVVLGRSVGYEEGSTWPVLNALRKERESVMLPNPTPIYSYIQSMDHADTELTQVGLEDVCLKVLTPTQPEGEHSLERLFACRSL